jgi:hypothetical protein
VEELGIKDARRRIDMMLALDFIIANDDRHNNNFGLIRNANTLEWLSVAPIFDSGHSMWHRDLQTNIDPHSTDIKSAAFNNRLHEQIKHVKDFSWLNFEALNGIEDEYAEILKNAIPKIALEAGRNKKLCLALRTRIEMLKAIAAKLQ